MEDHREVAAGDDDPAEEDRQTRAEQIVCNQSARESGQVNSHRVPAVNRRRAFHVEAEAALRRGRDHIKDEDARMP